MYRPSLWYEKVVMFRIVLCFSIIATIIFDGVLYKNHSLSGFYLLCMANLGLCMCKFYIQLLVSGSIAFMRYAFLPNETPNIESFIFQWFVLFSITFIITTLLKHIKTQQSIFIETAVLLAEIIDKKDRYTAMHSKNVAHYATLIGKRMNLSKSQIDSLYFGGLIHDIGKIGIPDAILQKNSRLTDWEYQQILLHPSIGYHLLKNNEFFKKKDILDIILYHHERYDGFGYPEKLRGNEIPILARIISVADAFDAMTSFRAYNFSNDIDYAIEEITNGLGTQFDPIIGDVFLQMIETEDVMSNLELNKSTL